MRVGARLMWTIFEGMVRVVVVLGGRDGGILWVCAGTEGRCSRSAGCDVLRSLDDKNIHERLSRHALVGNDSHDGDEEGTKRGILHRPG